MVDELEMMDEPEAAAAVAAPARKPLRVSLVMTSAPSATWEGADQTSAPNPKFAHTERQMRSRTSGSKGH